MQTIANSLERFIRLTGENKLWALGVAIAGALFWWVVAYYLAMPRALAEFDRHSLEYENVLSDAPKVDQTYVVISDTVKSFFDVRIQYLNNFSNTLIISDNISPQIMVNGFRTTGDALYDVANARGFIKGTQLYEKDLDAYKDGFAGDLTAMEGELKSYQGFYLSLISHNREDITKYRAEIGGPDAVEAMTSLISRLESFNHTASSTATKWQIDIQEQTREIRIFWWKCYGTIPAIIYLLWFAFISIRGWRRIKASLQPQRARAPNSQAPRGRRRS